MPNLYKQYYVRTQSENKRVINSNDIVEQRLEKLKNTFTAGIITQETEVVEEINPVEDAKAEAEQMLEQARTQADRLVQQAQTKAAGIEQQAWEKGYREGREQQLAELKEQENAMQRQYDAMQTSLNENYSEKMQSMEKDLVNVILEVFNKVFHIQFDNKKDILMHLIDDAILNVEGDKKFRIKVADSNALFLENHKEEILERVGHGIEIEIIADVSLDGNACILETDSGVFDCSLGVQLENLIKDLKSLCS